MYNYVISDWFSSIDPRNRGYDLIISNPLYLTDEEYAKAQEEVRSFEPPLALIAGAEIIRNENTRRLAIWVKLIRTKMGVWIRILSLISQPM